MAVWEPPAREYDFLFNEVFDAIDSIQGLDFDDFDADFLAMLIDGWATHSKEVWLPINELGIGRAYLSKMARLPCLRNSRTHTGEVSTRVGWPQPASPSMEAWESPPSFRQ